MRAGTRRTVLRVELLESRTTPDGNSAGDLGIQANKLWDLELTGQGIFVGQIEPDRSAAKNINGQPFDPTYHPDVQPQSVYHTDQPATQGRGYDVHPTGVAGIIISRSNNVDKKGISVDAKLISTGTAKGNVVTRFPRTYQHVAKQNQGGESERCAGNQHECCGSSEG